MLLLVFFGVFVVVRHFSADVTSVVFVVSIVVGLAVAFVTADFFFFAWAADLSF